jgi:hypothetical protein
LDRRPRRHSRATGRDSFCVRPCALAATFNGLHRLLAHLTISRQREGARHFVLEPVERVFLAIGRHPASTAPRAARRSVRAPGVVW